MSESPSSCAAKASLLGWLEPKGATPKSPACERSEQGTLVTGRYVPGSAAAPAASLVSLSPVAGFAALHSANESN